MSNWKVGPGGRIYHPTTGAYVGQLDDNGNEQMVLSAFPSDLGAVSGGEGVAVPSLSGRPIAFNKLGAKVCVYGGTPAGVMAAIAAARQGAYVDMIVPPTYSSRKAGALPKVGGMLTGGLMNTDQRGFSVRLINKLTAEMYSRAGRYYGQSLQAAWFQDYGSFEPHIMERVMWEMLNEAGVQVHQNWRLVESASCVTKSGSEIVGILLENPVAGSALMPVGANQYVDASYECDLMKWAGVSYTVGREAAATYSESNAGKLSSVTSLAISPYVTAGDSGSGLLPGIVTDSGAAGDADSAIMGYNFRLTMTTDTSNMVPYPEPEIYNPLNYEIQGRRLQATPTSGDTVGELFALYGPRRNNKTDFNNIGWFGTNFVGMSHAYPDGTYAQRDAIEKLHRDYVLGYIKWIKEDSRVPTAAKTQFAAYGFSKDEYQEYGGMSPQLYVREGRRMLRSGAVIHTQNGFTATEADDPIVYCTYPGDLHDCRRVTDGTNVWVEGHAQTVVPNTWALDRKAILPMEDQCSNLQVVCGAAVSHAAYGSYRMELYYMGAGEAAGISAGLAASTKTRVGEISGWDMRDQLGRMEPVSGVMDMDTGTAGTYAKSWGSLVVTGAWLAVASLNNVPGYYGAGVWHDNGTSKGSKSVRMTPNNTIIPAPGMYRVRFHSTTFPNYQKSTLVNIKHGRSATPRAVILDSTVSDMYWMDCGTYYFAADGADYVEVSNAGGEAGKYLSFDAFSIERVG